MTEAGPAFDPGAYVVRYDAWDVLATIGYFLAGGAAIAYMLTGRWIGTEVGAAVLAAFLFRATFVRLRRELRREVVFAVHLGGVYFGPDATRDHVPWDQISKVEYFTEIVHQPRPRRGKFKSKCVGARRGGTIWSAPPGNGKTAYIYRQMNGWRADQAQVAAAVALYAPGVPVVNGPDYHRRVDEKLLEKR